MKAAYGTYINIFNEKGNVDVYVIFPEFESDMEIINKIDDATEEYITMLYEKGEDITNDKVEHFIENNCDYYDAWVIIQNK